MHELNTPALAREVESLPPKEPADTRTLRRITALNDWPVITDPAGPTMLIAVLDTETEGFDPAVDHLLEIAVALVKVDAEGRIVEIVHKRYGLQDPGRPLAPKITQLTGLTDARLAGKSINVAAMTSFIGRADALLAHHAFFDSGFCRRLLPGIAHLPWICSCRDVDWLAHGYDGAKLGHLLMQQGLFALKAHSAGDDVTALVNLLATSLPNGRTVLAEALATARRDTVRVEAHNPSSAEKNELKRRGYKFAWAKRVWSIDVSEPQAIYEQSWLQRTMPRVRAELLPITWHERHC